MIDIQAHRAAIDASTEQLLIGVRALDDAVGRRPIPVARMEPGHGRHPPGP